MKFQRRLSQPRIIFLQDQPPRWSIEKWWQRFFRKLSWPDIWETIVKLMVGSAEPVIEKQCDRNGQTYYTIYDPVTQQQVEGLTESEVRTWLEQRYYQ